MLRRSLVTFGHPAEMIAIDDVPDVLDVRGAGWFVGILEQVPGLEVDPELVQEDWGVVVRAARDGKRFWIGLSAAEDGGWMAHLHHGVGTLIQRFVRAGRDALAGLHRDLHAALEGDARVHDIRWHDRDAFDRGQEQGAASPDALWSAAAPTRA